MVRLGRVKRAAVGIFPAFLIAFSVSATTSQAQQLAGINSCGNAAKRQMTSGAQISTAAVAIYCLINAERQKHGLPKLSTGPYSFGPPKPGPIAHARALGRAAKQHAEAAESIKWWVKGADSHRNPRTGTNPIDRIKAAGYCNGRPRKVSEVTWHGWGGPYDGNPYGPSPAGAVHWWVNVSKDGHREIVLDRNLKDFGAGIRFAVAQPGVSDSKMMIAVVNFGAC